MAGAHPNKNWFYYVQSNFPRIGAIVLVNAPGNTVLVDTRFLSIKMEDGA